MTVSLEWILYHATWVAFTKNHDASYDEQMWIITIAHHLQVFIGHYKYFKQLFKFLKIFM